MKITDSALIFHFSLASFFFSASVKAFTSCEDFVLDVPIFNFSNIFLNILLLAYPRYIPALFRNSVPNRLHNSCKFYRFCHIFTYNKNYLCRLFKIVSNMGIQKVHKSHHMSHQEYANDTK